MTELIFLISGMPRVSPKSCAFWQHLINRYNPSVYVHTWHDNNDNEIQTMLDVLKPVKAQIDKPANIDISQYDVNNYFGINIYNCLSSWTSINRVYALMEQHTASLNQIPNTVLRSRFDI